MNPSSRGRASATSPERIGIGSVFSVWQGRLRSFLRYGAVGALAACLDLTVFFLLSVWLNVWYLFAHSVSRGLGGMVNFTLNRAWTFGHRGPAGRWPDLRRFAIVYLFSYCGSSGLLSFFHEVVQLGPVSAKLVAEGTMFIFNFLALRAWAFRGAVPSRTPLRPYGAVPRADRRSLTR